MINQLFSALMGMVPRNPWASDERSKSERCDPPKSNMEILSIRILSKEEEEERRMDSIRKMRELMAMSHRAGKDGDLMPDEAVRVEHYLRSMHIRQYPGEKPFSLYSEEYERGIKERHDRIMRMRL